METDGLILHGDRWFDNVTITIYVVGYNIGAEGRPGRQAGWARILVQNAPIIVANKPIFNQIDQIYQIPVGGGHIVCSQHTAQHSELSSVRVGVVVGVDLASALAAVSWVRVEPPSSGSRKAGGGTYV